jgi:nucleotide-binding universal stress UspA family protein
MKKLTRLLAAVDFSERSRVALGFAGRLACAAGAELHILHAQDPLLSSAAERRGYDLAADSRDELRAFAAATWPVTQCALHFDVIVGHASTVIAHAADRERADLVVVAAHGMSGVEHAVLGSTAEGVLRRSNVPVLVVPDGWTAAHPDLPDLVGEGPVIVGVDFRLPSLEAASGGAALAAMLRSELVLMHVIPVRRVLPRWTEHLEATLAERISRARQDLERLAESIGDVPVRVVVDSGRPAQCLADAARAYPHGLLIVGRSVQQHGHAPPGRTAYRAITFSQLPVLMHVTR